MFRSILFNSCVALVVVIGIQRSALAQPPITYLQFGTSSYDVAYGVSATAGGIYVVGVTAGILPGQNNAGESDAFIRKYDTNGIELWTRQFGTTASDGAFAVSATVGGVYIVGVTAGTFPGQNSAGGYDAFIRKYDTDGVELWTRQFGSSNRDDGYSVSAVGAGVYVAGTTQGTLPGQTSGGSWDAYVAKYDSNGTALWTRQFGTSASEQGMSVSATAESVHVTGATVSYVPPLGIRGAFVRKYDGNGGQRWVRQIGVEVGGFGTGLVAFSGRVTAVGYVGGALPGQTSAGQRDAFVRTYNSSGTELWTRQFGTTESDFAVGVSAAPGAVYVLGGTNGVFPGQTNAGFEDVFIRKYDGAGVELWTTQFGSSDFDSGWGISFTPGGVYVVGETPGALPGQNSAGGVDAFLAILSAQ